MVTKPICYYQISLYYGILGYNINAVEPKESNLLHEKWRAGGYSGLGFIQKLIETGCKKSYKYWQNVKICTRFRIYLIYYCSAVIWNLDVHSVLVYKKVSEISTSEALCTGFLIFKKIPISSLSFFKNAQNFTSVSYGPFLSECSTWGLEALP